MSKPFVGQSGCIEVGDMLINVTVVDSKKAFGRMDVLVRPVAGTGQNWMRASSVVGLTADLSKPVADPVEVAKPGSKWKKASL